MVVLVPELLILPGLIVQLPDGSPFSTTLPVETAHVGWVMVPTEGAAGVTGWALITTLADAAEVHPEKLVTVKLCVPVVRPEMVVLVPDPEILPGLIVQLPVGKPFSTTLPVETVHVGCVMVPTPGAAGVTGCALMTTFADTAEVHPEALVTVKLWVPVVKPEIVVLVPDPEILPGLIVQLPDGKPFSTTLPVETVQVGWVMVPTIGATGVTGCGLITALAEATEVHPEVLVTVKLYVPATRFVIVVLVPDPAILPGFMIQLPTGKPFRATFPVDTVHVGCVMVPIRGAAGIGCGLITTVGVACDGHPDELVTVR